MYTQILKGDDFMKNVLQKISLIFLKMIPVCTAIMLTTAANTSASWIKGQDEVPASAKRYRKF